MQCSESSLEMQYPKLKDLMAGEVVETLHWFGTDAGILIKKIFWEPGAISLQSGSMARE